ncbi:amidase [Burkholderia pyrrocinia]|uniref:amidase n=1 Tax=Burkholderia pyrrocinia TaxID=60550 RepID=UPI000B6665AD|nr:amidase [Burkholderia territorii]HDR9504466.1 amidase [Burkholderia cepacia]
MSIANETAPASRSLFQSASQWLAMLRDRRIGAVELLELHLAQVAKHNPDINAVVARDLEGAFAAARAADSRPRSELPPLHGLPMTIKDTFEVTGMPATCGFPFLADHRPQRDADAVARLRTAGAIIYGKTNVPPGAFDWQSSNPVYGATSNPWDLTRTPGGSSGGPAASVAAGFAALELGSDIGGSIRCPAHFCGVYGHKTSYGIVPLRGHIPPLPDQLMRPEMGVAGPLARSAFDLELALDVLTAPEQLEGPAWSVRVPVSRHERLQDFRVAVWADNSIFAVDTRCVAAIEEYANDLRGLGVQVNVGARPDIDWKMSYETYLATLFQLMAGGMSAPTLHQHVAAAAQLSADDRSYPARLSRALALRHYEYVDIAAKRELLYRQWRDFFSRYDLLICPVMPTVAYPHDHRGDDAPNAIEVGEARTMVVNGQPRPYFDGLQWPAVATVANLPATAVPTGRFVDGMPVGVQLIGPYLEDRTPLRFAQLVEQALGALTPPPMVA